MKTLLITHGKDTYPAGLFDIYSYLRGIGHDVDFINVTENSFNSYQHIPDFVGITSMTKEFYETSKLSTYVKKKWPNCKIVLGGRHFNSDTLSLPIAQQIMGADHIVVGEGEYAMRDIIEGKETSRVVKGSPISKEDYNNLPFPDKNFINKNMKIAVTTKTSKVLFSRGCPFKCVYCESETGRKPVISKDPDKCVANIKDTISWAPSRNVFIYDDIFAINKRWLRDFKDEWVKQQVKADLRCFIHGKLFDEETLEILKQINVKSVCLGAESGDNTVLKAINKQTTVEDYLRIHNLISAKGNGIILECLWMLGNITETNETMRRTVELSRRIGHNHPAWFSYAIPFPGTFFWKEAEKYGSIIEPDFRKWGNRTIVFLPHGVTKEDMLKWHNMAGS